MKLQQKFASFSRGFFIYDIAENSFCFSNCSNNRMGSQCSCERDPTTSSGYLSSSSNPFPSLTEKSQLYNTDL